MTEPSGLSPELKAALDFPERFNLARAAAYRMAPSGVTPMVAVPEIRFAPGPISGNVAAGGSWIASKHSSAARMMPAIKSKIRTARLGMAAAS